MSEQTNGITFDVQLDDVLRKLCQYADDVRYDYNPLDDVYEPDEKLPELCGHIADMIERDYIHRNEYDRLTILDAAKIKRLASERDEWKSKANKYRSHMLEYSDWHMGFAHLLGIKLDPNNWPSDGDIKREIGQRILDLQKERVELKERVDTQKRTIMTLKDKLRDVQDGRDEWKSKGA